MLSKYKRYVRAFLLVVIVVLVTFFSIFNKTREPEKVEIIQNENSMTEKEYPFRKYLHVKKFYTQIAKGAVDIGLKYGVPPASILAIAGLESGYGRGYQSRITGNIMRLDAKKDEPKLPSLYLPNIKNFPSKVLYLKEDIKKYDKSELSWKKRARSLKKDYRPKEFAGTKKGLDYFYKNPSKRVEANLKSMEEFAKLISKDSKNRIYRDAREMLDREIKKNSKDILFDEELNKKFINMIGGKKNSYNYRKTWPKKVILLMDRVGLVELTRSIYKTGKSLDELW